MNPRNSIDRFFDYADAAFDSVNKVVGIASDNERDRLHQAARQARGEDRRRAASGAAPNPARSTGTTVARRARTRSRVQEVIEESGETTWIVMDGDDRAVCNSAAMAEKIRVLLG